LVLVTYASSQCRYLLLFWSGLIAIIFKLIANAVLVPSLGIKGIALSWGIVYAINAQFFLVTLRQSR
jgi:O-antigen/teichoic acid export membrane protein